MNHDARRTRHNAAEADKGNFCKRIAIQLARK
jgi:hypothetical protein